MKRHLIKKFSNLLNKRSPNRIKDNQVVKKSVRIFRDRRKEIK